MIREGILCSQSDEGRPNFAPIGVILTHEDKGILGSEVCLSLYPGSQTYQNVLSTKEAVICFTDDVELFVDTALFSAQPLATPSQIVHPPRLKDALTVWELKIQAIDDAKIPIKIKALVVAVDEKAGYRGFCRGQMAIIEATVSATRIKWLPADKILADWPIWLELVKKTGGNKEFRALNRLVDYLNQQGIPVKRLD